MTEKYYLLIHYLKCLLINYVKDIGRKEKKKEGGGGDKQTKTKQETFYFENKYTSYIFELRRTKW